jgi:hypothetical protein
MATTSNYGWTTPDDSSLVKDGASAIRALGTAIDTSMNTALGTKKAGMVLLNTTSFSGVTAQSLNAGTFTSAYKNYKLVVNLTAKSATNSLQLRVRASGTDATGANYARAGYYSYGSGTSGHWGATGQTFIDLGTVNTAAAGRNVFVLDIANIQLAQETTITGNTATQDATGFLWLSYSFLHDVASSYDSLTLYPNAGTITGTVSVYGYNV